MTLEELQEQLAARQEDLRLEELREEKEKTLYKLLKNTIEELEKQIEEYDGE